MIPDLVGDSNADYLAIFDFDWNADWTLTGQVTMDGSTAFPESRPSVQWKLTDLIVTEVPEPATLLPMASGLAALVLAYAFRRRDVAKTS